MVAVAAGGSVYSAREAKKERQRAEDQADEERAAAERTRAAQEALMKSRNLNSKYKAQADYELAGSGAGDATTSFNGLDAFRINPGAAPAALNIPGGV
jgi:hypothetical protein